MTSKTVAWASVSSVVAAGIAFVPPSASTPSSRATAAPAQILVPRRGSAVETLEPGWSAQRAYDYMGRRPDKSYIKLGLPCAAWYGGWVKDWDPYFKKYGGRRATWSVELCWKPG